MRKTARRRVTATARVHGAEAVGGDWPATHRKLPCIGTIAAWWLQPHKDLFFTDLVRELARNAAPTILAAEQQLIGQIVAERADWLDTAAGRQSLVAELFRQLALLDFQTLSASPEWRTYLALHATSMPELAQRRTPARPFGAGTTADW